MDKQVSEAQKFFDSLPSEKDEEKFDFFQKPEGQEVKEPEPKEEEPKEVVPEKDEEEPRKNRQERRREQNRFWEEQLARERERAERLETELLKRAAPTQEETDARLTRLFGDTPQGKEASRIVSELLKETEERAVAPYRELSAERQAELEAESTFTEQIEDGIETIEDTYGIDLSSRSARQMRSDFLDFVDELSPEDSLVNFDKAWSLFQQTQKAPKDAETIQRKKEIASRSIQRSTTARPEVKTMPVSFDTLENEGFWSKLTGRR